MEKEKVEFFRQRIFLGLVVLVLIFDMVFIGIKAARAETITSITGSAQILNTSNSLYFTGYNTNVIVSNETHQFSGYTWSVDAGWIAFGSSGNPDGPVVFHPSTGVITGKARILNTGHSLDFNPAPYSSNVIISSSGAFSGYAWSEDVGWVNFSGVSAPDIDFGGNPINILPESDAVA